jgi:hypothetical protein
MRTLDTAPTRRLTSLVASVRLSGEQTKSRAGGHRRLRRFHGRSADIERHRARCVVDTDVTITNRCRMLWW